MTFDGITTRAVVHELKNTIESGFIKKINQIGPKQLTIQFYANRNNYQLYLSADSSLARFHLSKQKYNNPQTPPNFVMLLRKHIGQARLESINQVALDRTVCFTFRTHNELGDQVEKYLIIEIMGKHSNIILLDDKKRVLDAIQRVSHDMSRVRQIYPGKDYEIFPSSKKNVLEDDISLPSLIEGSTAAISKLFYQEFTGFSPVMGREICARSDIDPLKKAHQLTLQEISQLNHHFVNIVEKIKNDDYHPVLYRHPKIEYYPMNLVHLNEQAKTSSSLSELIDEASALSHRDDQVGQKKDYLMATLKDHIDKQERKRRELQKDYDATLTREELKEEADLLSSNIHLVERGAKEVIVEDFFHKNERRTIPLNPKKTAWDNANSKYHKYSKLKTANALLSKKIPLLDEDIRYLHQLALTIQDADSSALLDEIREELSNSGIIKKKTVKKKTRQEEASKPYHFITPNGFSIYVGRNNFQNDQLTLKVANKEDYFFHAKTIPGAHVILKTDGREPKQDDIEAAALLAAQYSSSKNEPYVDIDYTKKKNVYKAKGAKPGMVYYNDYQTMHVNTEAKLDLEEN